MHPERVCVPIVITIGGRDRDVVLDASASTPLGAVFAETTLYRGRAKLAPDAPLGALRLRAGEQLRDVPEAAGPGERHRLVVVGGIGAGTAVALPDLPHVVLGRGPAAHISIDDPAISVRHAVLHLEPMLPTVTDARSRNGTRVDGRAIDGAWPLDARAVLMLGRTALRLERTAPVPDVLPPPGADGTVPKRREPRHHPRQPRPCLPAPAPAPAPRFRAALPLLAVVAPAVGGALMAVIFRQPALLLLAAVGPIVGGSAAVRDRRARRREAQAGAATSRGAALEFARAIEAAVAAERAWRRAGSPDLGELLGRASTGHALWERRRTDADHLRLRVGLATLRVALPRDGGPAVPTEVAAVPHAVHLAGRVLGIVGAGEMRMAVARAVVVQAAILHGPADLRLAIGPRLANTDAWRWLRWLPHAEPGDATCPDVPRLTVLDGHSGAGLDGLGADGVVVMADNVADLPERCRDILHIRADGLGTLENLDEGSSVARILVDGCSVDLARRAARLLARFAEPDRATTAAGTPNPLLGAAYTGAIGTLPVWLGVTDGGQPLMLDLCRDGPHALVAGTTGAGKSELLRTLVTAACHATPPDRLAVLLVDYKGGAALAPLTALPHVRGLLTDLDGHLARRTLTCLEAELRAREEALAVAGFADVAAWEHTGAGCPPALLVVVDEFASLSRDLDGFVDGLVEVARRGRSLGIHLVLATQRPAGVVSDHIRANVDLRVCLRVQDAADSVEVLGARGAEAISRTQPGRGYLRRAAGELEPFRGACVSLPLPEPPPDFSVRDLCADEPAAALTSDTSLGLAIVACVASARPASPWPDPVPAPLPERTSTGGDGSALGLLDDPRTRSVHPLRLDAGHVAVLGASGAGKTGFLATYAAQLVATNSPTDVHIYGLDAGGGLTSAGLRGWPHVGAVVAIHDVEMVGRLLDRLRVALDSRAAGGPSTPLLVLLVDGLHALTARAYEADTARVLDALTDLVARGPGLGMRFVASADRPAAMPAGLLGRCRTRICLRLADAHDAALLGLPISALSPSAPAGRGVLLPGAFDVQIAAAPVPPQRPPAPAVAGGPAPLIPLPAYVPVDQLAAARVHDGLLSVPFGIDFDGNPAILVLRAGAVALVGGPPRAGKSAMLALLADRGRAAGVCVLAGGDAMPRFDGGTPTVVLLDEGTPEPAWLADALRSRDVAVIVAGTPRELSRTYTASLEIARRDPHGVLLNPGSDADADLFHVRLPRVAPCAMRPGRGYLVTGGRAGVVQVAATRAVSHTYAI